MCINLYTIGSCFSGKFVTVGLLEVHALLKFWYYCQIAFQKFESICFLLNFVFNFRQFDAQKNSLLLIYISLSVKLNVLRINWPFEFIA